MRPDEALNASSTSDIWKLHRDCKTCSFVVYKDFLVLKILFQLRRLRRPRFASSPPSSALPTASPVTASLAMMRSLVENDDVSLLTNKQSPGLFVLPFDNPWRMREKKDWPCVGVVH